ncbi:GNAT family N-acetyltransferase [Bradyrhizobium sp.]|uniref:GNAT family N-acetyltransferase n=1 Tax=Bradyrhizobium sp. TaxID=376 RepID=UPI003C4FB2C1
MKIVIRRAMAADAKAVHQIVLAALRKTNAKDYPPSVIDRLVLTLPDKVASNLETWCAFVAIVDGGVVGTGSLDGQTVSSVYVHPDYQRRGIATRLMDAVEHAANAQSRGTLRVQSSVTAKPFYAKRGFRIVRKGFFGDEPTIVMSKDVPGMSE